LRVATVRGALRLGGVGYHGEYGVLSIVATGHNVGKPGDLLVHLIQPFDQFGYDRREHVGARWRRARNRFGFVKN